MDRGNSMTCFSGKSRLTVSGSKGESPAECRVTVRLVDAGSGDFQSSFEFADKASVDDFCARLQLHAGYVFAPWGAAPP